MVFGNATVSTPFSIDALISSGYILIVSTYSNSPRPAENIRTLIP